jgi:hypothetical protein
MALLWAHLMEQRVVQLISLHMCSVQYRPSLEPRSCGKNISQWFSGTSGAQEIPTLLTLEALVERTSRYRRGGKAMSVNDLPAIMGTVLIVAGLALVGVSTCSRAAGSEKTTQAGALIIVVGAFLLGLSIFVSRGK